ncbi:TPA: 4-hydroxy-3-methylbut-2-enyl diphosphate reductase [Candidatus Avigastranaerophilus faecigallinarum]|nr:4-hydroxy-3-methylbut-2-enyl diphosphate reductase [Candidatus Avigastranaerophilus faecigallinarum]
MAQCAGFCYGVKRAVETTKKVKIENAAKKVWVLGELIHNSHVIKELEELGIMTVDVLPENESGICIVRSHGMAPQKIKEVEEKGFEVVDLTCLDVKKVQQKAIQLAQEGFLVLILGKPEHPEVVAIKANADMFSENVFVIPDMASLEKLSAKIKSIKRIGVVIQTTQKIDFLQEVVNYLIPIANELKVFNTICQSTAKRQQEAKELAKTSDLMIVVGGKNSANTTHLAEILNEITTTIHIETQEDLDEYKSIIEKSENIGVTAGASTPENIIKNVINKLNEI